MNKTSLYLKGILIGFCSLAVPGLSASTIAIVLLVYYDMIYAISHLFSKPKQSIPFLLVLLMGYFTGAAAGAIGVNTLYDRFPIPVVAAVLGFLLASIPRMVVESRGDLKKWPNVLVMVLVASAFFVYACVITGGESVSFGVIRFPLDYILLALVGMITSCTLVIPGVDFAVTLMALGYYYAFIDLVGDFKALLLYPSRLFLLLSYLIGYGLGAFLLSKGLRYLIKRFPRQLHCVNLAMVIISPVIVIEKCVLSNPNFAQRATWPQFCWAFLTFAAGYFAFTWVPMLCRYIGILPKDAEGAMLKADDAARHDVPKEVYREELKKEEEERR
jgi:putative membrane protein